MRRRVPRRALLLSLLALGVLLTAVAAAREPRRWNDRRVWQPPPAAAFRVTLEDGEGRPLRTFHHRGTTWVLGELGQRYAIRVHNPTGERVEAVVSVDGRDAVSGRPASFERDRGYLIPPHGSVVVTGFRQSLDRVATFRFSDPSDSYSARRGTPENVGVIGVAIFPEARRPRDEVAAPRADAARPAAPARKRRSASAESAPGRLGTEYGESRESSVVEVPFERQSSRPARVLTVRYDDAAGLEARGIEVFPRRTWREPLRSPDPFPASGRFAPPPP